MFKKVFNKNIHNNIYVKFSTNMLYFIIITTLFILFNLLFFGKVYATNSPISPTKEITITKIWENDNENLRPENIKVYLSKKTAFLKTGTDINKTMKQLSGTSNPGTGTSNNKIRNIIKADTLDTSKTHKIISTATSPFPVYMWYDSNTIYYYSEADNIYMNEDCAYTFKFLTSLEDISGLANFNTSYVKNMTEMFYSCTSLANINALSNWNVVNVEIMNSMFRGHLYYVNKEARYNSNKIQSLEPLRNWNVSNLVDMEYMFEYGNGANSFTSIEPIANWNVKCLKSLNRTFNYTSTEDGYLLCGWDPTTQSYTSDGWNVKCVTTFNTLFTHSPSKDSIAAISGLKFPLRAGYWSSGQYYPNSNTLDSNDYRSHPYTTPNADEFTTTSNNWVKNGNEWTYTFTVNNDNSIYTVWEEEVTENDLANYTSSAISVVDENTNQTVTALADNPIKNVKDSATITNTYNGRLITITKIWNDENNTSYRPEFITLHLVKDGTEIVQTSNGDNWNIIDNNTWEYVFEVLDNANYSVWEEPVSYYTSEAVQTSPIQIIDNTAIITNTFYNTYDITLIKKVTGNMARLNDDFEFEITIFDENNNQLSGNITIERDGIQSEIANNSKINLKHNEQIIIKDIIAGYKYTITESNTDYDESYKIDKTDETNEGENTILIQTFEKIIEKQTLNENQTVTFINNKDSVPETMVDINFHVYVYIVILSTAIIIATKHFTNN